MCDDKKRIYFKYSMKDLEKYWGEVREKAEKEGEENIGEVLHPPKLTFIEKLKYYYEKL